MQRGTCLYYDKPMSTSSVLQLTPKMRAEANRAAKRAGLSRSQWIRVAMQTALDSDPENTKAAGTNRGIRPADSRPPGEEPDG